MENTIYTINIGDFTANETTYPNRCLSASFGGQGVQSEVIPWEGTEYNPWDYKYEDGEFILDVIEIPEPTPQPTELDFIKSQVIYTALMTDTSIEE